MSRTEMLFVGGPCNGQRMLVDSESDWHNVSGPDGDRHNVYSMPTGSLPVGVAFRAESYIRTRLTQDVSVMVHTSLCSMSIAEVMVEHYGPSAIGSDKSLLKEYRKMSDEIRLYRDHVSLLEQAVERQGRIITQNAIDMAAIRSSDCTVHRPCHPGPQRLVTVDDDVA